MGQLQNMRLDFDRGARAVGVWHSGPLTCAAIVAATVPALLAYNVPPSGTLLNQTTAILGWGTFTVALSMSIDKPRSMASSGLISLLAALALLGAMALLAIPMSSVPTSLAFSNAGMIAVAAIMVCAGAAAASAGRLAICFAALSWAVVVASFLSLAVGFVQVFAPDWADGDWIARTGFPGRAVGNMRQPNHLSSLLLWAAIGIAWLFDTTALSRRIAAVLYALMIAGIVMSASRTGMVGVGLLMVWGLADRRLSKSTRSLLISSPLIYIAVWAGLAAWAQFGHHIFGAEERLSQGDISSSRFKIWSDTLQLISRFPWTGVGFGNFNFAWTLTPFPNRPVAFFDHTHNIVLQFAVELGIPVATLVLVLLGYAMWRAWVQSGAKAGSESGHEATTGRAALMMVLVMALHSQLEYPLWYAYFLLPTALAFGLCLGKPTQPGESGPVSTRPRWLLTAGAAVMLSGLVVTADYMRVVQVFAPLADAAPLPQRIESGRHSWFFAHHADYAAVTTVDEPSSAMPAFEGATHYLLDTRLMMAWADAYAEKGDLERARNLAQRLREFHNEKSNDFFAECEEPPEPGERKPFQCEPPKSALDFRDFR